MSEVRGPRFTLEPPAMLVFSNSSGGRADCAAEGSPTPRVEWMVASDGSPVGNIQGSRFVLANGSLVFPPFEGEHFRPDVHSATYKCTASNLAGRVVSLDVHVRAVVVQPYQARVYDAQVLPGNTAVFRCHVPTFVRDFLTVTSWLQDHTFNIYPTAEGDSKHVMLPSGELHVLVAETADSQSTYRCRTLHRLSGRTQESATAGQLIISEPKGPVAPRLTERSSTVVSGRRGEDLVIPCVAQGFPAPNYWWYRKGADGILEPLFFHPGERRSLLGGSLHMRSIQSDDEGLYVCSANSTAGTVSLEVQVRLQQDLSAHIVPVSLRADSGSTAIFVCVTTASKVVWVKDGQRVVTDESSIFRLVIPTVQREDQGMYQCIATSESDSVQATAELRLGASKPQLLYKFIEQTLQPGPDVSLKCIAAGQPTPQIHWTLDGFPLPTTDRFVIGQYVTVTGDVISHVNISKVAVEDGGTYECAAENRVGRTGHAAPLRVYGMPIVRKMPPISAVAGEHMTVTCPAAGFPIQTITWEKDGRVLPINHRQTVHPNGTLYVENVQQKTDQGKYTCQARNRQGHSDRGSVDINVMEPPSIYPFSIESSARLGERLGLQCLVTKGDAPLSIRWLKDETDVTTLALPAVTVRAMGDFSSTLLIERLSVDHGGRYTCEASNAAATASHSVILAVNVPPEITPFAFSELAEGARFQVACTVHRGDLPLNLTWLKNWAPLPSHVQYTRFNNYSSILTMSNVRRGDSGNYTCVARNPARATTHTSQLTISVPPEWVVEPRDVSAIASHSVSLHCQADGFPQPNVTWRRAHGKQASQFDELNNYLSNGTLILPSVTEKDEGYYLCEANNGIGAGLSAVIFLTVNALPRFIVSLKKETVRRGATASFLCEAMGDLPMQITWRHNGIRVSPDTNHRYHIKESPVESSALSQLSIRHVAAEDSGKYVCIASNPFGKDETVVQLVVQDVPEAPADVRVVECGSRDVKLSWSEPSDGNSPILYYSVTYTQEPDFVPDPEESAEGRPWRKLSNLQPATTYFIHVIAVNQLGPGPASSVISVTTEPEMPSGPPRDVTVVPTSPTELKVTWDLPSPEHRNGAIIGYYIGVMQLGSSESRYNYTTVKADETLPFVLRGLRSYTPYQVTVQAFNSIGAGPSSEGVSATTLESVPGAPPQDVQCTSLTSQNLQISWAPPSAHTHNGVIKGYHVTFTPAGDGELGEKPVNIETADLSALLTGLRKYQNYSVQVAAFTSQGLGPMCEMITCLTAEDVPSAPANVRAALASSRSAVISWSPPKNPNGVLLRYNVYEREIRRGNHGEPSRRTVPFYKTFLEAGSLREHCVYEWWVTAVTRVGEGPSTPVQTVSPNTRVPIAILTFPMSLVLAWKSDATFHCHSVGIPRPEVLWSFNSFKLDSGARVQISQNGSLHIQNIGLSDSGNYTCNVRNMYNQEDLTHTLTVLVPPSPPTLVLFSVTSSNVTVSIAGAPEDKSDVRGYLLHYRPSMGDWKKERLGKEITKYTIAGLLCGTTYEIFVTAYNQVGVGNAGSTLETTTVGDKATPPDRSNAISSSLQTITIHLDHWKDNECPILQFRIEQRSGNQPWKTVNEHATPGASYTIFGLEPATLYHIRVTAMNNKGKTVSQFKISTLGGVHQGPIGVSQETGPGEKNSLLGDLHVSLPIAGSILALVLTLATVTICLRKKPASCGVPTLASTTPNNTIRPEYYSVLHKKPEDISPKPGELINTIPDYEDDIYPYATFQAQKPMNIVSSHRGFQTFVYQGSGLVGVDSYAAREGSEEYSSVRQPLRSDTEDYDSLGSESDGQCPPNKEPYPSAYLNSNIRHSRLVSMLESSTSTEVSPASDCRRDLNKCRIKSHSPKKKMLLTKETAFTFPNHFQAAKMCEEMSEAECDREHLSPFQAALHYRV